MRIVRLAILSIIALVLAACATAPQETSRRSHRAPRNAEQAALHICSGHVSNAPRVDSKRKIINYDPVAQISGASINRAPVKACVSSGFGPRRHGAGKFHHGVDYYTGNPEPVYAGGDGVIEKIGTMNGYGRMVLIRHKDNVKTRYAHFSSYARGLSVGDHVRKGDLIGHTGDSGNATAVHLHYEIHVQGRRRDPLAAGS